MTAEATARPQAIVATPNTGLTLVALATAGMVVSVQQTVVIPLLPRLMVQFDASVTAVTWVFTASLLAGAVATPLLSRFGDMYGKKRMILFVMGLLVVGSMIGAVSTSLPVLVVGRVLQGVSSALIPLAIGVIRDTFPREKIMGAIGTVSATMGVGGTIGMIVTGLIADRTASHQPVFWITTGLAAAGLVLVAWAAPDTGLRAGGRPDLPGAVLLAAWLVCLLLAVSQGNAWGWASGGVVGLFCAAALLCAVWVLVEARVSEPLVRLRLLVGPKSLSANVASTLLGFSMFGAFTLTSTFIQTDRDTTGYGLSGSVLDVALYGLPSTVTMLVCSMFAGRIAARIGSAYTLAIGSAFAAFSYAWLAVSNDHVLDMLIFSGVQGVGFGIAYAALGTLAVQHVGMSESSIASGINSLVRVTGGSAAGAITAAILAASPSGAPTLSAYETCFWLITVASVLTLAVALFHAVRHAD